MTRLLVGTTIAVLTLVVPAEPAPAHEDDHRFRVCAAVSTTDRDCYGSVTYEAGQTVFLRGRLRPAHPGFGQVLRAAPGGRWRVVGTIGVQQDGRARWSWTARTRDVDGGRPHRFAFRVPGVARSNVVEIWIVPRHDP